MSSKVDQTILCVPVATGAIACPRRKAAYPSILWFWR